MGCTLDLKTFPTSKDTTCSDSALQAAGVDAKSVQDCVTAENNGHSMMESQLQNQAWSPNAIRINGWRYSGALKADVVLRAICSGFLTMPPQCTQEEKSSGDAPEVLE